MTAPDMGTATALHLQPSDGGMEHGSFRLNVSTFLRNVSEVEPEVQVEQGPLPNTPSTL